MFPQGPYYAIHFLIQHKLRKINDFPNIYEKSTQKAVEAK